MVLKFLQSVDEVSNILSSNELLGKIVYSKAGRDKGKYFIIIGIINEIYVNISDGDLRKVEKPKKKKLKHLLLTDITIKDIKDSLLNTKAIQNSQIMKEMQSKVVNREV